MKHDPAEQFLASLLALLVQNRVSKMPTKVKVYLHDGSKFLLPVDPIAREVEKAEDERAELSKVIIDTLSDAKVPLKASAIASRAKRSNSGHFRQTIKLMREAGEINQNDDGTYSLPED